MPSFAESFLSAPLRSESCTRVMLFARNHPGVERGFSPWRNAIRCGASSDHELSDGVYAWCATRFTRPSSASSSQRPASRLLVLTIATVLFVIGTEIRVRLKTDYWLRNSERSFGTIKQGSCLRSSASIRGLGVSAGSACSSSQFRTAFVFYSPIWLDQFIIRLNYNARSTALFALRQI